MPQELSVWLDQAGSEPGAQPAPGGASLHTANKTASPPPLPHTCVSCGRSDCEAGDDMLYLYVDIGNGPEQGYIHGTCMESLLLTLNLDAA